MFLKIFVQCIPLDSNVHNKGPIYHVHDVGMDIPSLNHLSTSCSGGGDNDDLYRIIDVSLRPYHNLSIVIVILEHSDCLPVFTPTFGGYATKINEYLLS